MKVKNMTGRTGREVPNQFIMFDDEGNSYFQSYNSVIVKRSKNGEVWLDSEYWDYSKTTSKYRNEFLGEDTKAIKNKIASGEYKLVNLNDDYRSF